jgi:murein DD-endopeptidase MepM/ murein hydrolase activator NlpD
MRSPTLAPLPAAALAAALAAPLAGAQQPAPNDAGAGTLIGRVVDDARCGPLAGATVRVAGGASARTDAAGRFRFGSIAPGEQRVEVARAGYAPRSERVEVRGGTLAYAEARLRPPAGANAGAGVDAPPTDGGSGSAAAPRVSTTPARPTQGTLFRLRVVMPDDAGAPGAELAGEPLHFVRTAPRTYETLAVAPVDAPDSLWLALGAPGAPAARVALAIAKGSFPVERLRVAPEFGREPDLALAERLERESERARDVGCRAHQTPRLWTRPFARPRPGRVTSAFGRAREYNGTVTSRHTGTDFAGATGAPVNATNRGVVRLVDRFYLGGNVVYLDHGAGVVSAYMHLSRTAVAVGDTVARGQLIGRVGSTGRVTGPHLHWVVRYGRISVDPTSLLEAGQRGAPSAER